MNRLVVRGEARISEFMELATLLGRTLVLVAHPDDEAVGCGGLLQRIREPLVLFATDGAPRDEFFWSRYGSRQAYAELRAAEARRALAAVGVSQIEFLRVDGAPIVDQELFRSLDQAGRFLLDLVDSFRPEAVLTLSYEGGHPDHDACSFLGAMLRSELRVPVFEMPLYHRSTDGVEVRQEFLSPDHDEYVLELSEAELARKRAMCAAYASQADVVRLFDLETERFRRQGDYQYSTPPHPGLLNYEAWRWPMTGIEVARAFADFLLRRPVARGERSVG